MTTTTETLQQMLAASAHREERLIAALERLAPPPQTLQGAMNETLGALRAGGPPIPCHSTDYSGTISEHETHAPIRVKGRISFQRKSDGRWVCIEAPIDDLGAEGGDLEAIIMAELAEKYADDLRATEDNATARGVVVAKLSREWKIDCYRRGRKLLHNLLLGQPIELIASRFALAEMPPSAATAAAAAEVDHAAV